MKNYFLPSDFKVYVNTFTKEEINHPEEGYIEKILPTHNHYQENDGGYVAIYTREKEQGIYSVGDEIYVAGQIRVKGQYINRVFYPEGYIEGDNITQDSEILEICNKYFPALKNKMWIGGDTGGWFGL